MIIRKIIKWTILISVLSFLLIWVGCLTKNRILTELHGDEIMNLNFIGDETVLEYDWFRVISYSEDEIEVYFVNKPGDETRVYEVGGIATYRRNIYGWSYQYYVLWSTAGTADTLIWPYWHHFVYYLNP